MNSNYGRGGSTGSSSFNFDFGLGSTRPKSLNDHKNSTTQTHSSSSSYGYSSQPVRPSWQPGKSSWTHQPTTQTGLNGPTSMVGDIFGKSWNSSSGSGSGVGIIEKNPNMFGDLVGSALGKGSSGGVGGGNVALKNVKPAVSNAGGSYSMGNLADSLPKTDNSGNGGGSWGYSGGYGKSNVGGGNVNLGGNVKSPNLGGLSMKSMSGGVGGVGIGGNKDPFGSLVDFSSKPKINSLNSAAKASNNSKDNATSDTLGEFQNASHGSTPGSTFPSSGFSASGNNFMGSNVGSGMDDFAMPNVSSLKPQAAQASSSDPLDTLFSTASGGSAATPASGGSGGQQFSEVDDWGLGTEFGSGDDNAGGATTELDGLPPPPAGVTASAAKSKGIDNKNQGQYADAIKWLSWAVVLLEKTGDKASAMEVLSCRASCYKEVGEYKKAVADCSKVLENGEANVSVLVQRALLYESMEKYRLGAEDLRTVLKIDPGNRIARSTIHRLNKMAD